MKKQFPGERDIYHCTKQPTGIECFVKGGLQPTRSFGDFRLKHQEFNFHNFSEELGFRRPIPIFSGPYVTHTPDIQVHELSPDDKWVILATDGLWKNFPRKNTSTLVKNVIPAPEPTQEDKPENNKDNVNPGQKLIKALME